MILYNNAIRAYVNVFLKHNILPHKCIHKCVSYFLVVVIVFEVQLFYIQNIILHIW